MEVLLGTLLAVGGYQDFKKRSIENWIPLCMLSGAICYHVTTGSLVTLITGLLMTGGIGLAYYKFGHIGGGDVKVIIGMGAMCGFIQSWVILTIAFVSIYLYGKLQVQHNRTINSGTAIDAGFPLVTVMAGVYLLLYSISKLML